MTPKCMPHATKFQLAPCQEPGQCPHTGDVQNLPRKALAVSAERNVHVFLKPRAERHVPQRLQNSADAARNVRIVEVFEIIKTENFPKADCHVGISGKVKIYLEGKSQRAPSHAAEVLISETGMRVISFQITYT